MKVSERIANLQPYLFARIEKKIADAKAKGIDVISLGIGDPDIPTPQPVVKELQKQAAVAANHRYPTSDGLFEFRHSVADYYARRFGVELDPEKEVLALIGSKEGIAHISLCYVNPGDVGLVTDPGYPVYNIGIHFAGGSTYYMPLKEESGFLPDFTQVPEDVLAQSKIMFLNYPNNPTGAVALPSFFDKAVEVARQHEVLICHDAAYADIGFDGYRPSSFLEAKGAKEIAIEFGSLSKPYGMTGWRIGWAAGNADAIKALGILKSNFDSGVFQAVQYAAIEALTTQEKALDDARGVYQRRRDMIVKTFNSLGWAITPPKASLYIWAPVPADKDSAGFVEDVFAETAVVITPGSGYGSNGEGYFRISLTVPDQQLEEALKRISKSSIRFK